MCSTLLSLNQIAFEYAFFCELVQSLLFNKPNLLKGKIGNMLCFPIHITKQYNFCEL